MSIAVIIPAFNEGKTIKKIIEKVKTVKEINRIIVVSDGSTDNTVSIAKKCGVEVMDLPKNIGKGGAMSIGVKNCQEEIIVFLDADLVGLTGNHIRRLIRPILNQKTDMTIGVFTNGRIMTDLAHVFAPFLSGQRAMKKILFEELTAVDISRYGVEMALTKYVKKNNVPFIKVNLNKLTHITKEEKHGFRKGLMSRFQMYLEILKIIKQPK
ncbi:MAG: glycosyltransferase family 2 protein [Bacilli bacterium]|jgi:glycosyltransferase involved in cell wall biosynthesis|nr:glycosyltransferase family 2 protein [Bacilli bacterium]